VDVNWIKTTWGRILWPFMSQTFQFHSIRESLVPMHTYAFAKDLSLIYSQIATFVNKIMNSDKHIQ
jgi:hypothetical protein